MAGSVQVGMNAWDIGATIGALGEATKSGESLRAGARLRHVWLLGGSPGSSRVCR